MAHLLCAFEGVDISHDIRSSPNEVFGLKVQLEPRFSLILSDLLCLKNNFQAV